MSVTLNHPNQGVAEIIIDRDDKRNALNAETVREITKAAQSLAKDDNLRVVVLRSSGSKAFSAGADITELAKLDKATAYTFIDNLRGAIQAIFDLPVPVICRIQGACIGGAMEMAAACDLRIATNTASFCMPEVRVGIPSVIQAVLLPRLMGRGRAGWLVLSGDVIDANIAYEWGFVEEVVAPDALDEAVESAITSILASGPKAVRAQKRLLKSWDHTPLDAAVIASMDTFAESYETDEPQEFMKKVLQKKKPA